MSNNQSYYTALLVLSESPSLDEARKSLIESIDDQEMRGVIKHILDKDISRAALDSLVTQVLDTITSQSEARSVENLTANNAPAQNQGMQPSDKIKRGKLGVSFGNEASIDGPSRNNPTQASKQK
jgi:hypothetical protein